MPFFPPSTLRGYRRRISVIVVAVCVAAFLAWLGCCGGVRLLSSIIRQRCSQLGGLDITIRDLRFRPLTGIVAREVMVRSAGSAANEVLLRAETVDVDFQTASLLFMRPRIKRLTVNGFTLDLVYDAVERRWNLPHLSAGRNGAVSRRLPVIKLGSGLLRYKVADGRDCRLIAQTAVCGQAQGGDGGPLRLFVETPGEPAKRSSLECRWEAGSLWLDATLRLSTVGASRPDVEVDKLEIELNYSPEMSYEMNLSATGLYFRHDAKLDFLEIAQHSPLGNIPAIGALHRFIDGYRAAGEVDVFMTASGNLNHLRQTAVRGRLSCVDVSVRNEAFPYLIEHIVGYVDFTHRDLILNDLQGRHKGIELAIEGWCRDFGPDVSLQITLQSPNMALDADLFDSLNAEQRRLWLLFSPSSDSSAAVQCRITRSPGQGRDVVVGMELLKVDATYGPIALPLQDLTGSLILNNQGVQVSNVVSELNGGQITLNGTVSSKAGQVSYDLTADAEGIEIGRSVKNLSAGFLGEGVDRIVGDLRPEGKVDLKASLRRTADGSTRTVRLKCLGNSISYRKFPYQFGRITGTVVIEDDTIALEGIAGEPVGGMHIMTQPAQVRLDGLIRLDGEASEIASIQLSASDLVFDERIRAALPSKAASLYEQIAPMGRFDLNMDHVGIIRTPESRRQLNWRGVVRLKDCGFHSLEAAGQLNGTVRTAGTWVAGGGLAAMKNTLAADSLKVAGRNLTNLKADIVCDRAFEMMKVEDLTAELCDGKLTGSIDLAKTPDGRLRYSLESAFTGIRLNELLAARPAGDDRDPTTGVMEGSFSLIGELGRADQAIGRCGFSVANMRVGRLSPLARLVTVFQPARPGDFAFDRMLVDSYIEGHRVLINVVDLAGRTSAFSGSGRMDLDSRKIFLTLTARTSRQPASEPSLLESLTEGLGRGVFRIDVKGDFRDPQITTTRLPVLQESLEILGTPQPAEGRNGG